MGQGVTVHEPGRSSRGYTLFCESYENPSATEDGTGKIHLIDMEGRLVHTWHVKTALQSFCRLLPNGNLLYPTRDRSAIGEAGLRELDPQSNVLWHYHCRIDHDYQILDDGNIMLHCIRDSMCPRLGPELKRHPYLLEINRDKDLLWEWHGEEHLDELEDLLDEAAWQHVQERIRGDFSFDWAHNNTCQVVPPNRTEERETGNGLKPRFSAGNIVFSYRSLDVIGVIERTSGEIVWAWGPGHLDGQHKPHVLPNGNLLIFDNGTLRGYSRVLELDPLSEDVVWEYRADSQEDFFSPYISGAQRLPNGNTLICEGNKGRLFEVTGDREIVWEFINPYHERGGLGSIYRCLRYTPQEVAPLLERIG
jgi:hypothetical protein